MDTRREFLKIAAGSMFALNAPSLSRAAPKGPTEWRNRQADMAYRRLGRTGFMISEIVMGGNEIRPANQDHVRLALDRGLNYLDTSPAYGRGESEKGYARVIQSRGRDRFFLTSKISLWDQNRNRAYAQIFEGLSKPEQTKLRHRATEMLERRRATHPEYLVDYFRRQRGELEAAALGNVMEKEYGRRIDRERNYKKLILDSVDESLARLGTDHLDIVMCPHGASSAEELTNYPETFDAFDHLKRAGKVRYLGVSSHSDPAGVLRAAVRTGRYAAAMVAYNIINHRFLNEAISEAHAKDVGVIAMKVARAVHPGPGRGPAKPERVERLQQQVRGKWNVPQKAYVWGLGNRHLSAVISNMVTAEHVEQNLPLPRARRRV